MPDLPPINEEATLDATAYIAALQAMAAAARAAADAQNQVNAALGVTQQLMDSMAAGAAVAAAAEGRLADAEHGAATAAAAEAAAAAAAANAEREQAAAAGTAAAAENAAAAAAARLAAANKAAGASAFDAAAMERLLGASVTQSIAAQAAMMRESEALRNAQALLAEAAQVAAEAETHLAEAEAAGSLAAYQDAQAAKGLAEADAALAAAATAAADATTKAEAASAAARAGMTIAEKNALGLAGAYTVAAAATKATTAANAAAGGQWAINIGWMRLTATALHWIIAGSLEFLAVAIPALVALGAGLLVASQGAQNVQQHMQALNTTTSAVGDALGVTTGGVLHLGNALQQAKDAANPGVYTILGAALNSAKGHMGAFAQAGLQVVHMWDEFAARVTVDLQGAMGSQIQGLLSGMVRDLQMFGQVLGNLGHALLNFASAMPGLAAVLLGVLDGITRLILAFSSLPSWIFMAAIAIEEFYRWGGLALTMLVRLTGQMAVMNAMGATNFFTRFGAALATLISGGGRLLVWAGTMISRLGAVGGAADRVAGSLAAAGTKLSLFAESMSPAAMAGWAGAVAVAAAAIGFLVYKIATARDSTQQWIAAQDQLVAKASDLTVLPTIYSSMSQTLDRVAVSGQKAATTMLNIGRLGMLAGPQMTAAGQDTAYLNQHLLSLWQTAQTVTSNAKNLASAVGVSVPTAMMAAQQAGVNLQASMAKGTQAFAIATQQIKNYFTGMGAMGAGPGQLGADVMALGIQSQLASSKVSQLNQAWDAWIQSVTGGVAAMAQVETAMTNMQNATAATGALLSGTIPRISTALQGTSYTLKGFGATAMQSWQQFTSAIQSGNTALDSMRVGMAEGVVSNTQYTNTVKGLVGQMAPFTQGNAAAVSMLSQLAKEAGGPVTTNLKTLEHWAGVTGRTARDQFAKNILAASIAMGNMSKVAQNLSAAVGSQLDQAMAAAIVQSSGLGNAIKKYAADLAGAHTPGSTLAADLRAIETAMQHANTQTGQAAKGLSAASKAADAAARSAQGAAKHTGDLGIAAWGAGQKVVGLGTSRRPPPSRWATWGRPGRTR